jgi:RNA polymerase sigma-70 factor (family 1)
LGITSNDTDKELLAQVAEGSEDAFRLLFERYRGKLYHYILTITESSEAAEDTVHDVFLKLWMGREKLQGIENLHSYLYRMSHNHAVTGLRRMAKETLILAELKKEVEPIADVDPVSQKEIRKSIQRAVDQLSPQQRKVFLHSREDGMRHEQIAEELGISVNTVRTHLAKALEFLRAELSHKYGPLSAAIIVLHKLS